MTNICSRLNLSMHLCLWSSNVFIVNNKMKFYLSKHRAVSMQTQSMVLLTAHSFIKLLPECSGRSDVCV